jgi:rhamnogalacturonyl hydrolase YesR
MFARSLRLVALGGLLFAQFCNGSVYADQAGGADGQKFVAEIVLTNPSEFERRDENTSIPLSTLGLENDPAHNLSVSDGKALLPSQLIDDDGDGENDSLVLNAGFGPAQSRTLSIARTDSPTAAFDKRTQAEISIKQGGAWEERKYIGGTFRNVQAVTPPPAYTDHSEFIRYEGPGIESDLVGYRVYLDWRNGFDIFGKKTPRMVLQDVGQDGYDSYHEMADWGMDVLKVGDAAGMGGYGFWDGEKMHRVADVQQRSVRILDNGPVYSQLEILYQGWNVDSAQTDLSARLAMQAGSRLVRTRLQLTEALDNIAVGIVKHPGTTLLQGDLEISGHAWTYVGSWGRQSLNDDHLGMMLLFRRQDRSKQTEDEHNYISVLQPRNGKVEYYFGAIWEQEPAGITTEEAFRKLLEREAEKLTMPLRQQLKTAQTAAEIGDDFDAADAIELARRLGHSEMSRNGDSLAYGGYDTVSNRDAAWRYTTGLLAQALDDLSQAGAGDEYAEWARKTIDSYITEEGDIRTYKLKDFNIDKINSGKMLLRLYQRHGDEKYLKAANHLREQLAAHPRTSEGAFWHKERYPWQLWLDGVYMGMPFLAHHAVISGDDAGLEEAVNEFAISRRHLRDEDTGLYFHAWDEKKEQSWADPDTGLSRHFWSRGMGWYAMALVDVLDFIPPHRADLREPLIENIAELAEALLVYRSEQGWLQITDMPGAAGNYPEASGSSMFVYMLAKAVNKGYLGEEYRQVAADAFEDVARHFLNVETDGSISLENICAVAGLGFGRDGSYRYYMSEPVMRNDPKGTAPFIMAGIQVSRLSGAR